MMRSLGCFNSACMMPLMSKNTVSIVLFLVVHLRAFLGRRSPFRIHCMDIALVSGRKVMKEDSSPVMISWMKVSWCSYSSRLRRHTSRQFFFCSSLSTLGMNFAETRRNLRSWWMMRSSVPLVKLNVRWIRGMETRLSCRINCSTASMFAALRPERGRPDRSLSLVDTSLDSKREYQYCTELLLMAAAP